jgi:hypothetical protein
MRVGRCGPCFAGRRGGMRYNPGSRESRIAQPAPYYGEIRDTANPVELLWKFGCFWSFIPEGNWLSKWQQCNKARQPIQFFNPDIQIILVSLFYE